MQRKTNCQKSYEAANAEIALLISAIQKNLGTHSAAAKAQPNNWGYVGDLARIREDLGNVLAAISSGEELTAFMRKVGR
jgi:hypothetical protein